MKENISIEETTHTQHVDNGDVNNENHRINITSNLLGLQKAETFCDVCFACSDGNVKGT